MHRWSRLRRRRQLCDDIAMTDSAATQPSLPDIVRLIGSAIFFHRFIGRLGVAFVSGGGALADVSLIVPCRPRL